MDLWGEEINRTLDFILDTLAICNQKLDRTIANLDRLAEHRARIANLEVTASLQRPLGS
jgi:hypothetical protein